jgi:hypothetical protein
MKRVCLHCFEDYTEPGKDSCRACAIDRRNRLGAKSFNVRPAQNRGWQGPTAKDIDGQDLTDGYIINHV